MTITVAPTGTISVEWRGRPSHHAEFAMAFDAMPGRLLVTLTSTSPSNSAIFLEFTADQLAALMNELVAVSEFVTS